MSSIYVKTSLLWLPKQSASQSCRHPDTPIWKVWIQKGYGMSIIYLHRTRSSANTANLLRTARLQSIECPLCPQSPNTDSAPQFLHQFSHPSANPSSTQAIRLPIDPSPNGSNERSKALPKPMAVSERAEQRTRKRKDARASDVSILGAESI